jgi:hypothetical protein
MMRFLVCAVLFVCSCGRIESAEVLENTKAAARAEDFTIRRSPDLSRTIPRDTLRQVREFGDSLSFARISGIHNLGDRLLVMDQLLNHHLVLIDLANGDLKYFGRHGEGPGEFRTPTSMSASVARDQMWLYDFQNRRFSLFDLRAAEPILLRTMQGATSTTPLEALVGEPIIFNTLSASSVLALADREAPTRIQPLDLGLPFDSATTPNHTARRLVNRTFLAQAPEADRVALVYQFTNRIDIISRDARHLLTVYGPREGRASYRIEGDRFFWNDDNVMVYRGVAATGSYLYLLYCGCELRSEEGPSVVHVFDWDGRFQREVALGHAVSAITVSADDRSLFGAVESEAPFVVEWSLHDIAS